MAAVVVLGLALVPAFSVGTSAWSGASAGGSGPAAGSVFAPQALVPTPPAVGQVTISSTGLASDPSVVTISGTTATLRESFDGNLTDFWANSALDGAGYTVNATAYQADANVIGIAANGVTVSDVSTISTASTDGIVVGASVSAATVEGSTVTIATGATSAVGIQAGPVFPATALEPSGAYVITDNFVDGPGLGGTAGEIGISVAGASVTVSDNAVSDLYLETTTTAGGHTYSSWFEDTQSVGIFAGCAGGASVCELSDNLVTDTAIGVAYALVTSGFSSITPAAAPELTGNVLTGSVAYGMVLEPTGSSGTTVVEHNTVNDTASGAPGLFLLGATF
ncbi:MAG TPA: hypothetical protein VMH49_03585, partial [Thermoplasmata archaeon]|nr:hypothetical protein [Thermoplasmata archaeon]